MVASWKIAALGAFGGAVIALSVVFGMAFAGYFPRSEAAEGRSIRAYLLTHPRILAEMTNKLEEQDAQAADAEERGRQISVDGIGLAPFFDPGLAYVSGPAGARTTFVEFFDYNCVHCRNTFAVVKAFYEAHKNDTRFAFVDYPIFGANSDLAASAAIAARRQPDKYIAFSFAMMGEKGPIDSDTMLADAKAAGLDMPKLLADMKDPQIKKTIAAAHALGRKVNFNGTPTFIVNGRVHSGELDDDALADLITQKGG